MQISVFVRRVVSSVFIRATRWTEMTSLNSKFSVHNVVFLYPSRNQEGLGRRSRWNSSNRRAQHLIDATPLSPRRGELFYHVFMVTGLDHAGLITVGSAWCQNDDHCKKDPSHNADLTDSIVGHAIVARNQRKADSGSGDDLAELKAQVT
jgi:hypothetical protein